MAGLKKPHVHPVDEAWLALGEELQIEPAIEIVDSHIHLWDFSDPAYFVAAYEADARSAGITASVYVDCTMGYFEDVPNHLSPAGEVDFARVQAESATGDVNVAAAIIGWADLCLDVAAVDETLDTLERAGDGRFRGVRTRATYDPDPIAGYGATGASAHLLMQDEYRRGVDRLHARGHILDIYAFHTQLDEVADLARSFPQLPIVLNHIGGPLGVGVYADHPEQVFSDWQAGMSSLATQSNVSVKIGGFAISRIAIIKALGRDHPPSSQELAELCEPWVDHCFAEFGANRCMFGSNFPVDKVAFPLLTFVNAMKHLTKDLTAQEQHAFFAGSAKEIYKIT